MIEKEEEPQKEPNPLAADHLLPGKRQQGTGTKCIIVLLALNTCLERAVSISYTLLKEPEEMIMKMPTVASENKSNIILT